MVSMEFFHCLLMSRPALHIIFFIVILIVAIEILLSVEDINEPCCHP